ncbi:MAG: T9SS type A sorting domain-containing protein, partial [Bacteroidales bacterium]|nr:T9SS type A sorting domain-containing protein [Bacteroidales bacterium]
QETENNFINFYEINLLRKYGQERDSLHPQVTEGRMKSWGINTYGAWSGLPEKPEHPYTFIIHPLKSGLGAIEKMIDPFSEKYRASLKSLLESAQNRNNDPWNIGIFVNNELDWGEKEYIPDQVLTLDNSVPARLAMENFLQNKYTGIENLNASWNSNFDSFTSVNGAGSSSFTTAFRADMDKYLDLFADTYYSVAAEEVKAAMPNHLYLGSRLHSATFNNSIVQNAASRHCDVVSVNIYNYTVKDFSISMEADKPLIIGEFHFGTGTHGVWGVGLKSAYDPYQQGQLFKQYIKEAASNANIVGAHWFTWPDQMVTGRKDGENYRIGLVNVTDQPYPELINAVKETSEMMYDRRSGRDTINNSSNNLLPEQEAINIFPNPSDGSFKVITQNSDRTRISVFTTYGKQVYSGMHTNNSDIKLPETVKGPLFITIEDREYVWKGKIIVL